MLDIIKLICVWLGYSLLAVTLISLWLTIIVIAVREMLDIFDDYRNTEDKEWL